MPNTIIYPSYTYNNGSRCRFCSIQDLVDYYVMAENTRNLGYAIQGTVQFNVEYRDYLRKNGLTSTIERLKAEAPYLDKHPESLEKLCKWWKEIQETGGLGDYDIQCLEIDEAFTVYEKKVYGLNGLKSLVSVAREASPCSGVKPQEVCDSYESEDNDSALYAALLWKPYPRFDADDYGDNRTYRCYYIRNHRIGSNFFPGEEPGGMQRVAEDIPVSYLPMVYYDGDSPVMYLMSRKQIDEMRSGAEKKVAERCEVIGEEANPQIRLSKARLLGRTYGYCWVLLEKRDPEYDGEKLKDEPPMLIILKATSFANEKELEVINKLVTAIGETAESDADADHSSKQLENIMGALEGKLIEYEHLNPGLLLENKEIRSKK